MEEQNQIPESPSAAPVLVPVSAEDYAQRRRWLVGGILAAAVAAVGLSAWIYKRNVDPIRALEAFDAGERLLKSARYAQAIASFDLAIALRKDYVEAYSMRARANVSLGRSALAIPDYNKVIELRPEDPHGYVDRGETLIALQEFRDAIRDFTRAVELDPKFALAYNLRGVAWRQMGDATKALEDFEKAVELKQDMNNLFQRGAMYQQLGQHEKAIADFSRVISFEPGSAQGYFARAQSYRAIGDMAAANRDHRTGRILDGR